jgi:hypothetical protein
MEAPIIGFVISLFALPLVLVVLVSRRIGFRVLPTLGASIAGVLLSVWLFSLYSYWQASRILERKTAGAVAWLPPGSRSDRIVTLLALCGVGIAIGLLIVLARWVYLRSQSA